MEKYIDVKVVFAEPMTEAEAKEKGYYRGETTQNPSRDGFHIHYTDNDYDSWCPKDVFEKSYHLSNPLVDTALGMCHYDYKERFKAEINQLKVRYERLSEMCRMWDEGELKFTPTCPREIYDKQLAAMEAYFNILEIRAEFEGIDYEE